MKPVRSIATTLVVGPAIAFGFLAGTSHAAHAAVTAAPAAPKMAIANDTDIENEDNDLIDILSPKSYSTNVNDIRSFGGGGYGSGWGSGAGFGGYPGGGLYGGYGLRGYC